MVGTTGLSRFLLLPPEEMTTFVRAAGFEVVEVIERGPYPDVEHQSRRAYLFAETPRGAT